MKVDLVWMTPNAESIIAEIARVSNPENQKNPEYAKLIKYLIKNKHWSPLEMANMCVRIETSRAIAQQILRHRSFSFQEFSQRYSEVSAFEPIETRKQATKNRQSSDEVFNPVVEHVNGFDFTAKELIQEHLIQANTLYSQLLQAGIAKECARLILPLTTQTTLYMTGSVRSWIHYLDLRDDENTQKEHQLVAREIRQIFDAYLPTVSKALLEIKKEEQDKTLLYKLLLEGKIQWPEIQS